MIDEEETFRRFGYRSTDWSYGSDKPIVAVCEGKDCPNPIRVVSKQSYRKLCFKCSIKTMEYQDKMREVQLMAQNKPEAIANHQKASLIAQNRPDVKAKQMDRETSDGTKKKQSKAHMGKTTGENNGNYKGGISNDEYCSLFDEPLKVAVRNYFNNRCFLCGDTTEENGDRQMSVHHVGYQKKCGCDNMQFCIYSSLCSSCHTKTNGSKAKNRWYWYSHITHKLFMEHPNYSLYHIPAFGFDQMYYNCEYVFKGNYKQRKSN